MFKNLFKKSYTSINTNDHGSAGVSRAESAKADKRAAEAAQEKPEEASWQDRLPILSIIY